MSVDREYFVRRPRHDVLVADGEPRALENDGSMVPKIGILLAILTLPGCIENKSKQHTEQAPMVAHDCRVIAERLRPYGFQVTPSGGETACGMESTLEIGSVPLDRDPLDDLKNWLVNTGWLEKQALSADGPGTSSFTLSKAGHECRVDGGAPSSLDDGSEIRQSDTYFVNADCRLAIE